MIASPRGGSIAGSPVAGSPVAGSPVAGSPAHAGRPSVDPVKDPPDADVSVGGRTMDKKRASDPPEIEIGEIWGRRRIIFLGSSALFVLLVAWLTRDVVLPFILAII